MKKYAADNLMLLRKIYPDIYKLVRNRTYDQSRIQIIESRNKQLNLQLSESDGRVQFLYSRYNPEMEAVKWLESIEADIHNAKNVLICGLGLGYHIQAFMEQYPDKKLYIYEPDIDVFLAAIECCDLKKILKSKQLAIFAIGTESIIQAQLLETIYKTITGTFTYTVLPVYRKLFSNTVDSLLQTTRTAATTFRSNLQTVTKFQQEWSENIILNIEKHLRSCSFGPMKGAGRGVPAVVVGSGPSLGMEIDWLRKLKNRAIIIAAGSSIQALLHHNIEPDFVVSMDPSDANHRVFDRDDVKHIPFLYTPTIKHTILEKEWALMMHAFFNNDNITQHFMDFNESDPIFLSTSTVTGTSIQAALYMGCSEIVFIGQDFSYPEDRFYTEGVSHVSPEKLEKAVRSADQLVENVNGGFNRTKPGMLVLKNSVELVMDTFNFSEYYNASKVGAVLKYTKPKTLEQLYLERKDEEFAEGWFRSLLNQKLAKYSPSKIESVIRRVEYASNEISVLWSQMESIEKHLAQSSRYGQSDQKKIQAWFTKFDEYWNEFTEHEIFKHIYMFLLQREYNYAARFWSEVNAETDSYLKLHKLKECIQPILVGFKNVTPTLQKSFDTLIGNLHAKEV